MPSVYVSVTHQRRVSEGGNLVQLVAFLPLSSVYGLVKRERFLQVCSSKRSNLVSRNKMFEDGI